MHLQKHSEMGAKRYLGISMEMLNMTNCHIIQLMCSVLCHWLISVTHTWSLWCKCSVQVQISGCLSVSKNVPSRLLTDRLSLGQPVWLAEQSFLWGNLTHPVFSLFAYLGNMAWWRMLFFMDKGSVFFLAYWAPSKTTTNSCLYVCVFPCHWQL